jgi:hypothetical protein
MSVYTGVTHSRLKAISLEADEATITRLNVTDSVLSARVRFTIAQVNAGATLVAAITGKSIRMVSCKAIAVGGAVGAVTTVDVLGTQTTAVKLVAFAQASLTRSTVLTAGGTGAAVLADGASFVANDVSTGITVGKTGSDVTTATHIDVIFDYVVV